MPRSTGCPPTSLPPSRSSRPPSDVVDLSASCATPSARCGPAFRASPGRPSPCARESDNLMFHAAIYASEGTPSWSGGRRRDGGGRRYVRAIVQRKESPASWWTAHLRRGRVARQPLPRVRPRRLSIPAKRGGGGDMNATIRCGGVVVNPGDVVVADEEGRRRAGRRRRARQCRPGCNRLGDEPRGLGKRHRAAGKWRSPPRATDFPEGPPPALMRSAARSASSP